MNRKFIGTMAVVVLVFGMLAHAADAGGHGKGKGCHRKGLEGKFSHKAHFLLKNKEELGLSDEQIGKIKDLKINAKKDSIRKNAEIEILAIDIKTGLWKDTVDSEALGKLIDQKYEIKKEKAKSAVNAYAALKNVLTEAQKDKLKGLCKKGIQKERKKSE